MNMNLENAVDLCRRIEEFAPLAKCHVALTGGCLYKDGDRKDVDILFYRIRQAPMINMNALFLNLKGMGFYDIRGFGWVYKANYKGHKIDMFFPEEEEGEYDADEFHKRDDLGTYNNFLKGS